MTARQKLAGLVAISFGFALWHLSLFITGRKEPWDGSLFLYCGGLFACGALCVMIAGRGNNLQIIVWPALIVLGEILYLATKPDGWSFWPLSLIALIIFAAPAIGGAAFGRWITGYFKI